MTLLSRPNEVIGKSDLMNQVWQGITVEEGSRCFHIANLQKVLGNGKNGTCYIATASGRAYCSVGADFAGRTTLARMNFKNFLHHAERFVTIVGSRGVGKSTLAVPIEHRLTSEILSSTH